MPPSLSVCNIALSEIRAPTIASLSDADPGARACNVHYDDCLQLLLEAHGWGFAKVRATLALLGVNDRSDEWLYAYAAPTDMAGPTRLVWPLSVPVSGFFYPWPYLWPRPPFGLDCYVLDGGVFYTNVENAVLEYVSKNVGEAAMPATFKRALELFLASRLAIALLDDRAKKGDLLQQAEAEKRRAMAEDMNRYPRHDRQPLDEVALARGF